MLEKSFSAKGRFIVILWLLPFFYLPGLAFFYRKINKETGFYWFELVYYYYYYFLFLLLLFLLAHFYKVNWRNMLGEVSSSDYKSGLKLTIFVYFFSIAAAYALFYPLSFIWPTFVEEWFINMPPVIYLPEGRFLLVPNLLSFIALVILPPIVEEFAFRGFLLHRFASKWGLNKAIILTSVLFGLTHSDPIGATVFGVAMCILYLKTQSLLLPIICHAFNNFISWLYEAYYVIKTREEVYYTLDKFRDEWYVGVICGLIVIAWIIFYLKGEQSRRPWKLPTL